MKAIERRVRKLEQTTQETQLFTVCFIGAVSEEEAEAQLAAYERENGEPTHIVRFVSPVGDG